MTTLPLCCKNEQACCCYYVVSVDKNEDVIDADSKDEKWNDFNDDERCRNTQIAEETDAWCYWQDDNQHSTQTQSQLRISLKSTQAQLIYSTHDLKLPQTAQTITAAAMNHTTTTTATTLQQQLQLLQLNHSATRCREQPFWWEWSHHLPLWKTDSSSQFHEGCRPFWGQSRMITDRAPEEDNNNNNHNLATTTTTRWPQNMCGKDGKPNLIGFAKTDQVGLRSTPYVGRYVRRPGEGDVLAGPLQCTGSDADLPRL